MRRLRTILLLCCFHSAVFAAEIVIFWQPGFPTIEGVPVGRDSMRNALPNAVFIRLSDLTAGGALSGTKLLVMPYGSAFPTAAWQTIHSYVQAGGALLVMGGRPFAVPVSDDHGFKPAGSNRDEFAQALGILHSYAAPQQQQEADRFAWRPGYEFLGSQELQPRDVFVLEGRGLKGLGYMLDRTGDRVSAPVVAASSGSPSVYLDFDPAPGFWDTAAGISLISAAARYSLEGAHLFSTEVEFSTVRPGETPLITVHVQHPPEDCAVSLQVSREETQISSQEIACSGERTRSSLVLPATLASGFYRIRATLRSGSQPQDYYENGFWVADKAEVRTGPALGVSGDFLTRDGKPFFPFGTNYFSTESNGWDFSTGRNAAVWEHDFAEMERHGMTFVRTGVWSGQGRFLEGMTGVNERFLRNVEAYLLCAQRHHIAVNFTFFAFEPQGTLTRGQQPIAMLPGTNPYLDQTTIRAEQNYVLSIVDRFKDVPYLCWDLINEPSFSNPNEVFRGNVPHNDPAELAAWHTWLRAHYSSTENLAAAWSVGPDKLGSFDAVPLPSTEALSRHLEHGDQDMDRAYDYNLFAQDAFRGWIQTMTDAIRADGSRQLIDVGQDEGGVQNRVLNQFYGSALSFTTNHTYGANQDLLWDSLAAKVPGVPNIVGETGNQPITYPNGAWRFDEVTGFGLIERKWAAGFAGGTSGALSWDWDREIYFGLLRSDGSQKTWVDMARNMSDFAQKAAAYASGWQVPEVAVVIPQSLQLSVFNRLSLEAQQTAIRVLYGYAHSSAYMIGEDQLDRLGQPKLIIVPSPWVLSDKAWNALLGAARNGATVLISGRFDLDAHFNSTNRTREIGIPYEAKMLDVVENTFHWPGGTTLLTYLNGFPDYVQQAVLPDGKTFAERQLGRGKILFATMPLELNTNLQAVGDVYGYALKQAGVAPVYSATTDPGLIICPTVFAHATLYFIASDTTKTNVSFRDARSGKQFSGKLEAGRAALLLVDEHGGTLASYNW